MSAGRETLLALRLKCLACRKCVIGGKTTEGAEWTPDGDEPITNVFSNMNLEGGIMVVGQNPGAEEVKWGQPFVGPSGKWFDEAIEKHAGVTRSQLYISNTVRCFTPGNRKPYASEVENCQPFLAAEIAAIKPRIIIALGSPAFKQLTGMSGIMKHCGEIVYSIRYNVDVLGLLHPSPYNTNKPDMCELIYKGMRRLREWLNESSSSECEEEALASQ
jgi:DNA polymerase